jgi:hypothetical protein|tara:strand:+ start:12169 stop:12270 length:102 start_codon:yes stop_codon:yes gene_type:complete
MTFVGFTRRMNMNDLMMGVFFAGTQGHFAGMHG